jgi:hypothetical protein
MSFLNLGKNETNRGLGLIWKCPHCGNLGRFAIIEQPPATLALIGVPVSTFSALTCLRCSECRYELDVPLAETGKLEELKQLTERLAKNELSAPVYHEMVTTLDTGFIKSLLAKTEVWKCPGCSEENPANFLSCWSCATKKDPSEVSTEPLSPPPGFQTGGGNAWEQ